MIAPLIHLCVLSSAFMCFLSFLLLLLPPVAPLDRTCLCTCLEMLQCMKECLTGRDTSQGGPHPNTTPPWTHWTTMGELSVGTKTHRGTQCCMHTLMLYTHICAQTTILLCAHYALTCTHTLTCSQTHSRYATHSFKYCGCIHSLAHCRHTHIC